MKLKDKIKQEYQKKGYSLYEFTKELGMSPSNFGNQVSREDKVQLGLIKKICHQLDIPIESILTDNDNREDAMIHEQLEKILRDGDKETVKNVVGTIGMEYMNLIRNEGKKQVSGDIT